MAYNTQEERLVVKGSERITRDLQVTGDVYVGGDLTVNVNLIANGLAGNNGQVLGKVNGKVEWFSPATIDTNDFKVNYLTVNNVANIADANIVTANVANLVVDNAAINIGTANDFNIVNLAVNASANINGDVFTHKGFDVTSMTVISENDYNNLGSDYRNQAFYMTTPNGNMYFYGIQYAPSAIPADYIVYANLANMANGYQTITTSTLIFTSGTVTNNIYLYNGIMEVTSLGNKWNNSAQIGTTTIQGNVTTNANGLYIVDASGMYYSCLNLIDTFVCNNALITGAPDNYDPMRYCTNMAQMFHGCANFNQPVTIPNSVENTSGMFGDCSAFNQPVTIPNSVENIYGMFYGCTNFNQPVTIPNSVENMVQLFNNCPMFNQPIIIPNNVTSLEAAFANCRLMNYPITIPNSVTSLQTTFRNCRELNQPIIIPENVVRIDAAFYSCVALNQPVFIYSINLTNMKSAFIWDDVLKNSDVPFHIRHEIALGDTHNYIYNCLVNNNIGIRIPANRIFNDL